MLVRIVSQYKCGTVESKPDKNLIAPRYNDSPDGDWVIGRYPMDASLILATAGSGHAYKVWDFSSIIGFMLWGLISLFFF